MRLSGAMRWLAVAPKPKEVKATTDWQLLARSVSPG